MMAGFTGTDDAFDEVHNMIRNWEETRTGDLEAFAEFVMMREERDLDKLLKLFRNGGASWPTAAEMLELSGVKHPHAEDFDIQVFEDKFKDELAMIRARLEEAARENLTYIKNPMSFPAEHITSRLDYGEFYAEFGRHFMHYARVLGYSFLELDHIKYLIFDNPTHHE